MGGLCSQHVVNQTLPEYAFKRTENDSLLETQQEQQSEPNGNSSIMMQNFKGADEDSNSIYKQRQFEIKIKELYRMVEKHYANELDCSSCKSDCLDIAKQLLHIWKDHKCSMVVTNVENGKTTTIQDPYRIQHKLCITTIGDKSYFKWEPKYSIWIKENTIICLKGETKKSVFDSKKMLYRHMVEITLAKSVFDVYGLQIPRGIVLIIGQYYSEYNDKVDSYAADGSVNENNNKCCSIYAENGLFYGNFNLCNNENAIYNSYIKNKTGDICASLEKSRTVHLLFKNYYQKIINAFNKEIVTFVQKNKFFAIDLGKVCQLKQHDIQITYALKFHAADYLRDSCRYTIIATLTGFNNLNLKKAIDKHEIESASFHIFWVYYWYPKTDLKTIHVWMRNAIWKAECNFLKHDTHHGESIDAGVNLRLIDSDKLIEFLTNGCDNFDQLGDEEKKIFFAHANSVSSSQITAKMIDQRQIGIQARGHIKQRVIHCSEMFLD